MEERRSLKNIAISDGRPTIQENETLIYRAREGRSVSFLIGFILTFIPPFIWGPLVIIVTSYLAVHSGVLVTDRRLIAFSKHFRPGKYRVIQIPLHHVEFIRRPGLLEKGDPEENLLDRLFGIGNVEVAYESEGGTKRLFLTSIKKPKKLVEVVSSRIEKLRTGI